MLIIVSKQVLLCICQQKEDVQTVKNAIEKQILKKPDKIKEYNPNDYYCTVCKYYLGYACLQPKFCPNCGQAIDRSVKE